MLGSFPIAYYGKRFRVYKSAYKTCNEVGWYEEAQKGGASVPRMNVACGFPALCSTERLPAMPGRPGPPSSAHPSPELPPVHGSLDGSILRTVV
jgi:hypothetical protein